MAILRIVSIGAVALMFSLSGALSAPALAQDWGLPFKEDSYRFLPRMSVLHQSGGFAGFEIDYRVRGTFDFHIEQSPLAVFPPMHWAAFENVDAEGVHPDRPPIDVDDALNLSGIRGSERLSNPRTPGLFVFRGTTSDKSTVDLQAHVVGPWLYVRGRTTPPAGSADFFEYSIKAVARRQPDGDFNQDGVVDAADLTAWEQNDAGTGDDLLNWQRQLGEQAPSIESFDAGLDAALSAFISPNVTAVPEPSTAFTLAVATTLMAIGRRAGWRLGRDPSAHKAWLLR